MAVLKVLPKGGAMVSDYAALSMGFRLYHGWVHDPKMGDTVKDSKSGQMRPAGGYVRQSAVITVPASTEYLRALKGDPRHGQASAELWPADLETAQLAGVKFDPTYGGDHPSLAPSTPVAPVVPPPAAPVPAPAPTPAPAKAGS